MSLEFRLQLLLQGNVISQSSHDDCLAVMKLFKDEVHIELNEENGQQYITHLARALTRIEQNEIVEDVDQDTYKEIVESEFYEKSVQLCDLLANKIGKQIPDSERKYLIMNHCYILDRCA